MEKTIKGLSKRDYLREYRENPAAYRCDCGQPAVRRTASGWVCARCAAMEAAERHTRIVDLRQRDPKPAGGGK